MTKRGLFAPLKVSLVGVSLTGQLTRPDEMKREDGITLTLHGVAGDNGLVRADVFVEKFQALVNSLKIADAALNGRKSHDLMITDLKISSAMASVREKVSVKKKRPEFAAPLVAEALNAVYNGDRNLDRFPEGLIRSFNVLTKVDSKTLSHGEIDFAGRSVVRIDDYLSRQTKRAIERVTGVAEEPERHFEGVAIGVFDGVLKELDSRGILVRGKLILTAGGREVECIFQRDDIPTLRESFERRARVEAMAHYNGIDLLPVRLDVKRIDQVSRDADLGKWRGALATRPVLRSRGT